MKYDSDSGAILMEKRQETNIKVPKVENESFNHSEGRSLLGLKVGNSGRRNQERKSDVLVRGLGKFQCLFGRKTCIKSFPTPNFLR